MAALMNFDPVPLRFTQPEGEMFEYSELNRMESLLPPSALKIAHWEDMFDKWVGWCIDDRYYVLPWEKDGFDCALVRISKQRLYEGYAWEGCARLIGTKDLLLAARILLEGYLSHSGINLEDPKYCEYRDMVDKVGMPPVSRGFVFYTLEESIKAKSEKESLSHTENDGELLNRLASLWDDSPFTDVGLQLQQDEFDQQNRAPETPQTLLAYCGENGRVCPQPSLWDNLWNMLPERKRVGAGWEPAPPLILGAWDYASNLEKMMRLAEHICWADTHGALSDVSVFLRGLEEDDWHHLRD